jgi:hypothetical protein
MAPLLRRNGGIWIGWSGASDEDAGDWARNERCFAIELPIDVAQKFTANYYAD